MQGFTDAEAAPSLFSQAKASLDCNRWMVQQHLCVSVGMGRQDLRFYIALVLFAAIVVIAGEELTRPNNLFDQ
jgi:hypothetical protein